MTAETVLAIKCFDQNIHRWYCQRGSDGKCPLMKCVEDGANRNQGATA